MVDLLPVLTGSLLFLTQSASTWNWLELTVFTAVILGALELMKWGMFAVFQHTHPKRLPPGGIHLDTLQGKDYAFIAFNKACTAVFTYHTLRYCWVYRDTQIAWSLYDMTILNTLLVQIPYYVIYDFFYHLFHRFLHLRFVYGAIHKHHHRQVVPSRGHDDAVNTHPFEFIVGEYLHLLAIYFIPIGHIVGVFSFILFGGLLAGLNHTRIDFHYGILFSTREHDTHHRSPQTNFAQYTMLWDRIFGSYKAWEAPKTKSAHTAQQQRETLTQEILPERLGRPEFTLPGSTRELRGKLRRSEILDGPETATIVSGVRRMEFGILNDLLHGLLERGCQRIHVFFMDNRSQSSETPEAVIRNLTEHLRKDRNPKISSGYEEVIRFHPEALRPRDPRSEERFTAVFPEHPNLFFLSGYSSGGAPPAAAAPPAAGGGGNLELGKRLVDLAQGICEQETVFGNLIFLSTPETRFNGEDVIAGNETVLHMNPEIMSPVFREVSELERYIQKITQNREAPGHELGGQQQQPGKKEYFQTITISPHLLYGIPRNAAEQDRGLPFFHGISPIAEILEDRLRGVAGKEMRILGNGGNFVSWTHLENAVHALLLAGKKLRELQREGEEDARSAAGRIRNQTFFVTDGEARFLWEALDSFRESIAAQQSKGNTSGFVSVYEKLRFPTPLLYLLESLGLRDWYEIRMLTMHSFLDISKSLEYLEYRPIRSFEDAFA